MKLAIIIPAYNEEKVIKSTLQNLPREIDGVSKIEIIVVNDGSTDKTQEIAESCHVTVISHVVNRGLGGALGTGFEYARRNEFDILLTFDADGQHSPKDIKSMIKPIINHRADVVIGSRLKDYKNMPWYRRVGNIGLNIITFMFFWVWTTDSQSGMRAFNKKAIDLIKIQSRKMEVSSEFFCEIGRHQLNMVEIPIKSIYTEYSLGKGQKNSNGFKILYKIIYQRLFS